MACEGEVRRKFLAGYILARSPKAVTRIVSAVEAVHDADTFRMSHGGFVALKAAVKGEFRFNRGLALDWIQVL